MPTLLDCHICIEKGALTKSKLKKIFVRADEAENTLLFYKHSVFFFFLGGGGEGSGSV